MERHHTATLLVLAVIVFGGGLVLMAWTGDPDPVAEPIAPPTELLVATEISTDSPVAPEPRWTPPTTWKHWNRRSKGDFELDQAGLFGAHLRPLYFDEGDIPENLTEEERSESKRSAKRLREYLEFMRPTADEMVVSFLDGWELNGFGVVELCGGEAHLRGRTDFGSTPTFGVRLRDEQRTNGGKIESTSRETWLPMWDLAKTALHEWQHFELYGTMGMGTIREWAQQDSELLAENQRHLAAGNELAFHIMFVKIREHREVFEGCLFALQARAEKLITTEELLPRRIWSKLLRDYRYTSFLIGEEPRDFPDEADWISSE